MVISCKKKTFQNISLRQYVSDPWFIRNTIIHRNLRIPSIQKYLTHMAVKQNERNEISENPLINESLNYQVMNCRVRRLRLALITSENIQVITG